MHLVELSKFFGRIETNYAVSVVDDLTGMPKLAKTTSDVVFRAPVLRRRQIRLTELGPSAGTGKLINDSHQDLLTVTRC